MNNSAVDGYMVRGKSVGFITASTGLQTIAHELGHGIGALSHTWNDIGPEQGTTDNLMDYSTNSNLIRQQWEELREPKGNSFWDEEEDAESVSGLIAYYNVVMDGDITISRKPVYRRNWLQTKNGNSTIKDEKPTELGVIHKIWENGKFKYSQLHERAVYYNYLWNTANKKWVVTYIESKKEIQTKNMEVNYIADDVYTVKRYYKESEFYFESLFKLANNTEIQVPWCFGSKNMNFPNFVSKTDYVNEKTFENEIIEYPTKGHNKLTADNQFLLYSSWTYDFNKMILFPKINETNAEIHYFRKGTSVFDEPMRYYGPKYFQSEGDGIKYLWEKTCSSNSCNTEMAGWLCEDGMYTESNLLAFEKFASIHYANLSGKDGFVYYKNKRVLCTFHTHPSFLDGEPNSQEWSYNTSSFSDFTYASGISVKYGYKIVFGLVVAGDYVLVSYQDINAIRATKANGTDVIGKFVEIIKLNYTAAILNTNFLTNYLINSSFK